MVAAQKVAIERAQMRARQERKYVICCVMLWCQVCGTLITSLVALEAFFLSIMLRWSQ